MNVPKLRFKEFNDDWNLIRLGDCCNLITKGTTPNRFSEYGIKFIKIESLINKKIDNNKCLYVDEKTHITSLKRSVLEEKDVLFAIAGATIGKCGIVEKENLPSNTNQALAILRTNPKKLNPYFLLNVLDSNIMKKYILLNISVGAQPNLNLEQMNNFKFKLPSEEEQLKVANFLSLLDKKIELQSKKIEDLKLFKKGLINSIGKNIEIEKIPLKNILAEQNRKTTKNNEYEILSSTSKGIYLQKDYFNKQAASDNNVGYKILKKNQLVLSPQNLWMGNININSKYNIGIVSPSYKIFDINNNIDIDFFDYWIKSPKALYEYKISSEQGASIVRRNLNMYLFYEIKVDIPKGKMQNKLGKIIKLLNLKIQYNENLLQKLQELKKGLMQNMFV